MQKHQYSLSAIAVISAELVFPSQAMCMACAKIMSSGKGKSHALNAVRGGTCSDPARGVANRGTFASQDIARAETSQDVVTTSG